MALTCPRCGLLSPDEAETCDCGYNFITRQSKPKAGADPRAASKGVVAYVVFLLLAAGCWAWMWFTLEQGPTPATASAVPYLVVLVCLACGWMYSFLKLPKRLRLGSMSVFIELTTAMGVSGGAAALLGMSESGAFTVAVVGGLVIGVGLAVAGSRFDRKRQP
jgi:FtsH-binding integral membrane protein